MAKIAIVLNASWNIYNFRLPLLQRLAKGGHEIVAIAPEDAYTTKIPYEFHPVNIKSRSTNPLRHLGVLVQLARLFRRIRPDIALLYTIHPNIYGNIAARMTGAQTISNIAGLGSLFIQQRFATRVAKRLYRFALKWPHRVFFQNQHDLDLFVNHGLVTAEKAARIPGSGVDLERFNPAAAPAAGNPSTFLMATRMLWDKGVREFAEAARAVSEHYPEVRFRLMGPLDADNPAAISTEEMARLTEPGHIEYAGVSDAMEAEIARAGCVVLPSYREGLPKVLLEAAAMARPIITTRVPGCMDVVDDGANGFLCEPADAADLAEKMRALLGLPEQEREQMGAAGRSRVEREFDQELVIRHYESAVKEIEAGG